MKINALTIVLSLACFSLSGQVDKTAVTTDFINGWASDAKHSSLKKHFSPNLIVTWQDGNNWPDGSEGSLEQFWPLYTRHCKQTKTRIPTLEVRELGDETYAFFVWEATIKEHGEHPEWVGTTAVGPGAYRILWEGDKIKHIYFYVDFKSREAQHEAASKK